MEMELTKRNPLYTLRCTVDDANGNTMPLMDVNSIFIPVSFKATEFTFLELEVACPGVDSTQFVGHPGLDRRAKIFNRVFGSGAISVYATDVCGRNDVSTIVQFIL